MHDERLPYNDLQCFKAEHNLGKSYYCGFINIPLSPPPPIFLQIQKKPLSFFACQDF